MAFGSGYGVSLKSVGIKFNFMQTLDDNWNSAVLRTNDFSIRSLFSEVNCALSIYHTARRTHHKLREMKKNHTGWFNFIPIEITRGICANNQLKNDNYSDQKQTSVIDRHSL